jgi:hypothetical protein
VEATQHLADLALENHPLLPLLARRSGVAVLPTSGRVDIAAVTIRVGGAAATLCRGWHCWLLVVSQIVSRSRVGTCGVSRTSTGSVGPAASVPGSGSPLPRGG